MNGEFLIKTDTKYFVGLHNFLQEYLFDLYTDILIAKGVCYGKKKHSKHIGQRSYFCL